MKIRIYFNLHRKLFTVQHMTAKGWRVLRHAAEIHMHFPRFKVSEAGRQRVLREKRKNVHAFIEGIFTAPITVFAEDMEQVTYNPYKTDSFVIRDTGIPVQGGRYLVGKVTNGIPSLLAL